MPEVPLQGVLVDDDPVRIVVTNDGVAPVMAVGAVLLAARRDHHRGSLEKLLELPGQRVDGVGDEHIEVAGRLPRLALPGEPLAALEQPVELVLGHRVAAREGHRGPGRNDDERHRPAHQGHQPRGARQRWRVEQEQQQAHDERGHAGGLQRSTERVPHAYEGTRLPPALLILVRMRVPAASALDPRPGPARRPRLDSPWRSRPRRARQGCARPRPGRPRLRRPQGPVAEGPPPEAGRTPCGQSPSWIGLLAQLLGLCLGARHVLLVFVRVGLGAWDGGVGLLALPVAAGLVYVPLDAVALLLQALRVALHPRGLLLVLHEPPPLLRPPFRWPSLGPPPPPPVFVLPPFLDAPGVLAIFAARSLLMPRLRRPSYCLSSFTLDPWFLAIRRWYPPPVGGTPKAGAPAAGRPAPRRWRRPPPGSSRRAGTAREPSRRRTPSALREGGRSARLRSASRSPRSRAAATRTAPPARSGP